MKLSTGPCNNRYKTVAENVFAVVVYAASDEGPVTGQDKLS